MKTFKKYFWIGLVLCAMILFIVWGIYQERYREWEQLQAEIKISAEEALQAFEEAGLHFENVEDTTINISKARYRYGDPHSAFHLSLVQEKLYSVLVVEYPDWKAANHTIEYLKSFLKSNSLD